MEGRGSRCTVSLPLSHQQAPLQVRKRVATAAPNAGCGALREAAGAALSSGLSDLAERRRGNVVEPSKIVLEGRYRFIRMGGRFLIAAGMRMLPVEDEHETSGFLSGD